MSRGPIKIELPAWPWWVWAVYVTAIGFGHGFGQAMAKDLLK